MSEPKEVHRLRMRLKRSHPDWTTDRIRSELERFTGSQTTHSGASQNERKSGSLEVHKSSSQVHKPPEDRYLLSFSIKKRQYVIYKLEDGKKLLVGSRSKNSHFVSSGPVDVELTWGPDNSG